MGVAEQRARAWMKRCLGVGVLFMAGGLVPVMGCWLGSEGMLPGAVAGLLPGYLDVVGAGWSQCVGEHPLGSPALFFFGGMLSLGVGVIFRDVARQRASEGRELDRRVERVGREMQMTPMMSVDAMRGEHDPAPEAIEIEGDLDFGAVPP